MDLLRDLDFSDTLATFDRLGMKNANVYFLTKRQGLEDQWRQILPTPWVIIQDNIELELGGSKGVGDAIVKNLPINRYSQADLTSSGGARRYWVISGNGVDPKAYFTKHLRRGKLFWDVLLSTYKSINDDDLVVPGGV